MAVGCSPSGIWNYVDVGCAVVTEELPGSADLVRQLVLPNLTAVAAALGRERGGRNELC